MRHTPTRRRRGTLTVLALSIGSALLAGCGRAPDRSDAGRVESLLERTPDAQTADVNVLEPSLELGWGANSKGGWSLFGEQRYGRGVVRTKLFDASLVLPVATVEDRTLAIEAAVEASDQAREALGDSPIDVRLNGISVGGLPWSEGLEVTSFETPASLWKRGSNLLEFVLPRRKKVGPALDLARVVYGDGTARAQDGRSLVMRPDEGVTYLLTAAAAGSLELRTGPVYDGGLEVTLRSVDSRTGALDGTPALGQFLDGAELTEGVTLQLPRDLGPVARLELLWRGEPGVEGRIERLDLRRDLPDDDPLVTTPRLIVFVSVDTLSAKHMSLYGYERPTTPWLDRHADELIVFESCTTNAPWTVPSYLAQFTGLLSGASKLAKDSAARSGSSPWSEYQLASGRTS
ncbi:MAG: sulfatase-like hydrolase/transferase, partial [Planctomycetota bacterium]